MAYIGNQPTDNFVTFATQNFSTSATSSYTLSHAVSNENEIALFINNVRQHPGSGKAYTASGTALTLSANTASTDVMYCIFLGRAIQSTVPATNSITAAMVGNDLISGKDALTSSPADTDELLISDAGVLKRIDVSLVGGKNTPAFEATHSVVTGISDNTYTKGNYTTETFDTDGKYDTTNKRFTPTVSGKYYIYASAIFDAQGIDKFHSCEVAIYKNGSIYRKSYFDQYDNYLAYGKTPFLGTIVDMDTDDYVEAYYLFNLTTGTNHRIDNGGVFGGYKLIT